MSLEALKEDLKTNRFHNVYLLYGEEEYLKKYYADSIQKKLLSDELKALNLIVLDGKADAKSIMDNCETFPVFSEKKIVVVKNSGFFKAKKKSENDTGKKKSKDDELTSYLNNVPEHTCLIFFEAEIDKRMKIVDAVKKKGLIVEFTHQKPADLVRWVEKVAASNGKEIDAAAASKLVDFSEQGMNEILNEVNKVLLYTGSKTKIKSEDVDAVCTKSVKSRIFDLTDAIAEKNCTRAFELLNDMIVLKEPVPKILFMIARQFRHVLEMKLLREKGMRPEQAAGKIGITPYAAGKVAKQSSSFSTEALKQTIEECLELDLAVKTGRLNDRAAVELLIARFAK